MRHRIVYGFLLLMKIVCRCFYSYEAQWIGKMPKDPWRDYRLVGILNHTSLFEFVFSGIVPNKFLWRMARYGTIPIAQKTMDRPLIGVFWSFAAGNIVSISRERDDTWKSVMDSVDPRSMVIILPEGRMKRKNGRDSYGRRMRVRSGIVDLIETASDGYLLLAYSQGLHHIHIPDHSFLPRLFRPVRMRFEAIDIAEYREAMKARAEETGTSFVKLVIQDLDARRDRYCTSDQGERVEAGSVTPEAVASEAS